MNLWQYYNGDLKYPDLTKHAYIKEVAKVSPKWAFEYVEEHGINKDLEPIIAKSSYFAYKYACIINKPFPLGEHEISKRCDLSYRYANEVLKGPFPLGEPAIAKNAMFSYYYAKYVLMKDFYLDGKLICKYKG